MSYIPNNKFTEIRNAAKDGNEKAKMVLQGLRNGRTQEDIERLIQDYYAVPTSEPVATEPVEATAEAVPTPEVAEPELVNAGAGDVSGITQTEPITPEDLTEVLDKETEGLFDENEIENIDFAKFLGNKHRDGLRSKKNAEYFKAFNPESVKMYADNKKEKYKSKFTDSLHDIDHTYNDYNVSLDKYMQGVTDTLDDDLEIDNDNTNKCYDDITNNNGIMHCFGRHWDNDDTQHIVDELRTMCGQYGKKNVLAALNILKSDNNNYRDYKLGQINEEVERYNKGIDKLFK